MVNNDFRNNIWYSVSCREFKFSWKRCLYFDFIMLTTAWLIQLVDIRQNTVRMSVMISNYVCASNLWMHKNVFLFSFRNPLFLISNKDYWCHASIHIWTAINKQCVFWKNLKYPRCVDFPLLTSDPNMFVRLNTVTELIRLSELITLVFVNKRPLQAHKCHTE